MGACFSRSELEDLHTTAKVISANGELHEYPVPVTVALVLQSEVGLPSNPEPSPASSSTGYFVCNSDGLYYEERIPALAQGEGLVGNQIYFVLPESQLDGMLTVQEMAALAVKGSLALQKAEEKCGGRRRRRRRRSRSRSRKSSIRISPVVEVREGGVCGESVVMNGGYYGDVTDDDRGSNNSVVNGAVLRSGSGSFRKRERVDPSKRAIDVRPRPYRTRLSTIDEGTVL